METWVLLLAGATSLTIVEVTSRWLRNRNTSLLGSYAWAAPLGIVGFLGVVGVVYGGGFVLPEVVEDPAEPVPPAVTASRFTETHRAPSLAAPANFVVRNDQYSLPFKRTVEVELQERFDLSDVAQLGSMLKSTSKQQAERTFIEFRLRDQPPGTQAWAVSHWAPEPDIRIQGFSNAKYQWLLKHAARPSQRQTVGRWLDEWYYGGLVEIYVEDGVAHEEVVLDESSKLDRVLDVKRHGSAFKVSSNNWNGGEYTLLSADGDLSYWAPLAGLGESYQGPVDHGTGRLATLVRTGGVESRALLSLKRKAR